MADTTLYDTTAPSDGSVALAHEKIVRLFLDGVFVNITGDITNLNMNPSPIKIARETYGQKTHKSEDITGYDYAPTFDVEVVRDPATKQIVAGQAWFKDLVEASFATGGANTRRFQFFTDALDESMPVLEGNFSVAYSEAAAGFADKNVVRFTLGNKGVIGILGSSPIAGDGKPILEAATPSGLTVGDLVKVRGYNLDTPVSATIDGVSVVKIRAIDANTVALLIPTGVSGSAPIIVSNAAGASAALAYTAA